MQAKDLVLSLIFEEASTFPNWPKKKKKKKRDSTPYFHCYFAFFLLPKAKTYSKSKELQDLWTAPKILVS